MIDQDTFLSSQQSHEEEKQKALALSQIKENKKKSIKFINWINMNTICSSFPNKSRKSQGWEARKKRFPPKELLYQNSRALSKSTACQAKSKKTSFKNVNQQSRARKLKVNK